MPPQLGCDRWPLHYAARVGDLTAVKYLVDVLNVDLNEADTHDATPLYLAALTGRDEICRFLLERGAKCDPVGDAARVFYVALTPELRNLLRDWSLTAASRDPYIDLLRQVINDEKHADCRIMLESSDCNTVTYLHKAMLSLRCPTLLQEIESCDNDTHVISYEVCSDKKALADFVTYLYTGWFETKDIDRANNVLQLASHYNVDALSTDLQAHIDQEYNSSSNNKNFHFREISGNLRRDMVKLAQSVSEPDHKTTGWDFCVLYNNNNGTSCKFYLHSFIVCAQSSYFDCALSGSFSEATTSTIDMSYLAPSEQVLRLCIQWMYADCFVQDVFTQSNTSNYEDVAMDLLEFGAAIVCSRLCMYTANAALVPSVNLSNVFAMIKLARDYTLEKLEEKCVQIIASNLESMLLVEEEQLLDLFRQEIAQIEQKGDKNIIDIPIGAEIVSALNKMYTGTEMQQECDRMVAMLNNALKEVASTVENSALD